MFRLYDRAAQFRKFLSSFLLIQLLVTLLLAFNLAYPGGQVFAGTPVSRVIKLIINPADNSLWVIWDDDEQEKTFVSHFDADGKFLTVVTLQYYIDTGSHYYRDNFFMDFASLQPQLYYVTTSSSHPLPRNLVAVDMKSGVTRKLLTPDGEKSCQPYQLSIFNPVSRHLYVKCVEEKEGEQVNFHTVVFNPDNAKILKTIPDTMAPIFAKAGVPRIYFQKRGSLTDAEYYNYDIVSWDAKTDEPDNLPPLIEKLTDNANLYLDYADSFQVNLRTGKIYLKTVCCISKYRIDSLYIFDKDQHLLSKEAPLVTAFTLNEAANQMYGNITTDHRRQVIVAMDAFSGPYLAYHTWNLLAVDGDSRGYVYGEFSRHAISEELHGDPGLGLVVINPKTFSVLRTIPLRAPSGYFQDKVKRLESAPANFKGRFFPETGHTLSGKFLDYWEKNGGLARFGYPITEPFEEYNQDVLKNLTVQYFERNRFEIHPENAGTQYEVLLGRLGQEFVASVLTGKEDNTSKPDEIVEIPDGVYFKHSGHTLTGKFYNYWKANGGLAQHGLPFTEPSPEVNPIDGKTYTVQYFERSRLELHPENAGTQYEVLMGHFGIQYLRAHGWSLPL